MCGILKILCKPFCRNDTRLDACCFCIPLSLGAIVLTALYILADLVLVSLYVIRYSVDPFTKDNEPENMVLVERFCEDVQPVVRHEKDFVLCMLICFCLWTFFDSILMIAVILHWKTIMRVWGFLVLIRLLHMFMDALLMLITCACVKNCMQYIYPNIASLLYLVPLLYARSVILSYAYELRVNERVQREVTRQVTEPPKGDPTAKSKTLSSETQKRYSEESNQRDDLESGKQNRMKRIEYSPKPRNEKSPTYYPRLITSSQSQVIQSYSSAIVPLRSTVLEEKTEETPKKEIEDTIWKVSTEQVSAPTDTCNPTKSTCITDLIVTSDKEVTASGKGPSVTILPTMTCSSKAVDTRDLVRTVATNERIVTAEAVVAEETETASNSANAQVVAIDDEPKAKTDAIKRTSLGSRRGRRVQRNPVPQRNRHSLSQDASVVNKQQTSLRSNKPPVKYPSKQRSVP